MATYYNLDNTIDLLFESNCHVTRQECDDFARYCVGGQVNPVPIQGAFSYISTAGPNDSKIIQFRIQKSTFKLDIMGIVDRAKARIIPFGLSLSGFENLLGCMDSEGWHYYNNRSELEDIFWKIFLEKANTVTHVPLQSIWTARLAGLFAVTASSRTAKLTGVVVDQTNISSFAFLDAFCLSDGWAALENSVNVS